jgi:DNA-binding FrmR family transcriptional regulator
VNEESRKEVIARLRSIAGHLKAVERMVEEDKYCVADAVRQGRSEKTDKELAEIFSTARK